MRGSLPASDGAVKRLASGVLCLGFLFSSLPALSGDLRPLYWSCAGGSCRPVTETGRDGDGNVLLGYIKGSAAPGTVPLYWSCAYLIHRQGCGQRKLAAQHRYDDSLLLGYIQTEPRPGTVPLFWRCRQRDAFGECAELAPRSGGSRDIGQDGVLLGYVYAAPHDRGEDRL